MVLKTGYILPAQNYVARMKALETGLANNKIRLLASTILSETPKVVVPTVATQGTTYAVSKPETGVHPYPVSMWNAETKPTTPALNNSSETPALISTAVKLAQQPNSDTALVREIKNRLAQTNFGLKPTDEQQRKRFIKQAGIPIINGEPATIKLPSEPANEELFVGSERERIKAKAKQMAEESRTQQQAQEQAKLLTPSEIATTAIADSSELVSDTGELIKTADVINRISQITTQDEFLRFVKSLKNFKLQSKIGEKASKGKFFQIPISATQKKGLSPKINDTSIINSWNFFQANHDEFLDKLQDNMMVGSGLAHKRTGTLIQYYHRNAPNFGNLFLNEKELKRGNLSISQPFSKSYVLHQKNISPLLKKMIFDIANTLEFDKQDYYNLDGEEKRIVEKIIRAQKDMKEMNIKKLIDDDDHKMKKRLQILVGQINAGNQSHLVKEEMRQLLKNLFDNRAISIYKYNRAIKSLDAL
jgi:hypothetical protein